MKCVIGRELEWDPTVESIVLYNIGSDRPGSFQWSDVFLRTFRMRFGYECPVFLPLDQRVDNSDCIAVLQEIGFQRASHSPCIITACVVNKELAEHGLIIERLPDGSESVHIDENKYVVNKMLQMTNSSTGISPSQCVHTLLVQCRTMLKYASLDGQIALSLSAAH